MATEMEGTLRRLARGWHAKFKHLRMDVWLVYEIPTKICEKLADKCILSESVKHQLDIHRAVYS